MFAKTCSFAMALLVLGTQAKEFPDLETVVPESALWITAAATAAANAAKAAATKAATAGYNAVTGGKTVTTAVAGF